MLTLLYFVVLPPFAWLARRAARREAVGWSAIPPDRAQTPDAKYSLY
jgi:hypothetical protein